VTRILIIACVAVLVGCTAPSLEEFDAASDNLALQRVERACGNLASSVTAARQRIQAVAAADRSVAEILQLQTERGRGELLCGPDADPINLVEIELITRRVEAIDGKVD